jgi:chloride channel 7
MQQQQQQQGQGQGDGEGTNGDSGDACPRSAAGGPSDMHISSEINSTGPEYAFSQKEDNVCAFRQWLLMEKSVEMDDAEDVFGTEKVRLPSVKSSVVFGHEEEQSEAQEPSPNTSRRRKKGGRKQYESADYELRDSYVWHRRKALSRASRKQSKIAIRLIVVAIGLIMGIVGIVLSIASSTLLSLRYSWTEKYSGNGEMGLGFLVHLCSGLFLAFLSFMVVTIRPISAGSGIAEAKGTLNGVMIADCTSRLTALCKGLSVIFSSAAALPVGTEGPTIHIGLCVGANIVSAIPRDWLGIESLRSDRMRRDFAAVGTAAGVAAAFRTPVGGVLFAMEEGSSFWSTLLTWRCFASACACMIGIYFILHVRDIENDLNLSNFSIFNGVSGQVPVSSPLFHFWEYALFALLGVAGGLAGALFVFLNGLLANRRRQVSSRVFKCLEVLAISFLVNTLTWWLPLGFQKCTSISNTLADKEFWRQFDCPDGYYNELATLFLNSPGEVGLNLLYHEGAAAFSAHTCLIAGSVYFLMLIVTFGSWIAAGIFIPLLFVGASFGRALGILCQLSPSTYAIIGSAAMLGGVVRVLISLTVILVQALGLTYFVTPLMLTSIIARAVGDMFNRAIYESIMEMRGIPFLEEEPAENARQFSVRARHIMSPNPVTLPPIVCCRDLLVLLRSNAHSTFPVVEPESGMLIGLALRTTMLVLLSKKQFSKSDQENVWFPTHVTPLTFVELNASYPEYPSLSDINLTEEEGGMLLDLTPYLQIAPHCYEGHGSAERAYEMFRTLGLRSLQVVDHFHRCVGIITRHDLLPKRFNLQPDKANIAGVS